MESWWTPKTSESDFRGQNSMTCGVLYIIEKLLKRRCLKWAHIAHLNIWNTSYGQFEGPRVKLAIWLPTIRSHLPEKVRNRPDLLVCRRRATYCWKALNEGHNFAVDRISIWSLFTKLWSSKVAGVPTWAISGLPSGSLGTKNHLDVGPVERCRVYYKGEGGGFPQV